MQLRELERFGSAWTFKAYPVGMLILKYKFYEIEGGSITGIITEYLIRMLI
jgi:hypothetical protein